MLETRTCCPHCQRMVLVDDIDLNRETICPHCETRFVVLPTSEDALQPAQDDQPRVINCHRCGKAVENKTFYLATFLFSRGSCSIGPEARDTILLTGNGGPGTHIYTQTFRDPDGYQALLNGQFLESVARRYLTYFTQAYGRTYGTELGEARSLHVIPPDLCLRCGQDDIRNALSEYAPAETPAMPTSEGRIPWWEWLLFVVGAGIIVAIAMSIMH